MDAKDLCEAGSNRKIRARGLFGYAIVADSSLEVVDAASLCGCEPRTCEALAREAELERFAIAHVADAAANLGVVPTTSTTVAGSSLRFAVPHRHAFHEARPPGARSCRQQLM